MAWLTFTCSCSYNYDYTICIHGIVYLFTKSTALVFIKSDKNGSIFSNEIHKISARNYNFSIL